MLHVYQTSHQAHSKGREVGQSRGVEWSERYPINDSCPQTRIRLCFSPWFDYVGV